MTELLGKAGRPLSGLERVWLAGDRIAPPFVNQCVVLSGPGVRLDPARMRRAVWLAAATNPGIGVRLAGRLRKSRWVPGGPSAELRLVDGDAWDTRSESGAEFLESRLDPWNGPVAEVLLVAGPGERQALVFRTHHAALDGRGTQLFIEDVFAVYDGRPPRGAEAGPTLDLDLVGPGPRAAAPPADAVSPLPNSSRPTGSNRDAMDPAARSGLWRRITLPRLPSPVLPRVICAVERAAGVLGVDGPMRVGVPVDLRRARPELRSLANLTGVAHLEVPRLAAGVEAMRTLLAQAVDGPEPASHVRAADAVRGVPLWLMTWAGRRAAARCARNARFPVSFSVSNLGRQSWTLGGESVTAFWIPPPSPGLPLFLSLTGGPEGVELCASATIGHGGDGRLDAFVSALVAALIPTLPGATD